MCFRFKYSQWYFSFYYWYPSFGLFPYKYITWYSVILYYSSYHMWSFEDKSKTFDVVTRNHCMVEQMLMAFGDVGHVTYLAIWTIGALIHSFFTSADFKIKYKCWNGCNISCVVMLFFGGLYYSTLYLVETSTLWICAMYYGGLNMEKLQLKN